VSHKLEAHKESLDVDHSVAHFVTEVVYIVALYLTKEEKQKERSGESVEIMSSASLLASQFKVT
jgi:hypothetical protein